MSTSIDFLNSEVEGLESGQDKKAASEHVKSIHRAINHYQQEIQSLESGSNRDDTKQDLQLKLNDLKAQVQTSKAKNEWFEYAEVILQIAIVFVSASIVAAGTILFWSGIALGVLGSITTLNGYLLFFS